MKRSRKLETLDNQVFQTLEETEAMMVSGGGRKVTGKATYKNGGADGEVDFVWTF